MGRPRKVIEVVEEAAVEGEIFELLDEPVKEEVEEDVVLSVPFSLGKIYAVFEDDRLIGYAKENSSKLAEYQKSNYDELGEMLRRYSLPFEDEKDILFANLGSDANNYNSWAQYQHQLGVAPSQPPVVNLLGYHGKRLNTQDPEEIVIRTHAFKYVFQEIEELD